MNYQFVKDSLSSLGLTSIGLLFLVVLLLQILLYMSFCNKGCLILDNGLNTKLPKYSGCQSLTQDSLMISVFVDQNFSQNYVGCYKSLLMF